MSPRSNRSALIATATLLSLAQISGCGGAPEGATASAEAAHASGSALAGRPRTFGEALARHGEHNGALPRTIELADGLYVDVEQLGRGPNAERGDELLLELRVSTLAGAVIEDTRGSPRLVPLDGARIFPGLARALEGMTVGTRARVHVPAALAYGDSPAPSSAAGADLVVDLHLMRAR